MLRSGGTFGVNFIADLWLNVIVNECWKSVSVWWSYVQECGDTFFLIYSFKWPIFCPTLCACRCWHWKWDPVRIEPLLLKKSLPEYRFIRKGTEWEKRTTFQVIFLSCRICCYWWMMRVQTMFYRLPFRLLLICLSILLLAWNSIKILASTPRDKVFWPSHFVKVFFFFYLI